MNDQSPSAFPMYDIRRSTGQYGMSLRDYFAGQALVGLLTRSGASLVFIDCAPREAYKLADAMISERDSKQ